MPPGTPSGACRWVFLAVFAFPAGLAHAAVDGYRAAELESWRIQPGMNGRQTWRQVGLQDYTYRLRVACNCALNGESRVYVVDGKVARVEDREGRVRQIQDAFAARFTVPALFRLIDEAAARRPDSMTWRLDRRLGYPAFIRIDPSYRIADDETDYRLDRLRPLVGVEAQL